MQGSKVGGGARPPVHGYLNPAFDIAIASFFFRVGYSSSNLCFSSLIGFSFCSLMLSLSSLVDDYSTRRFHVTAVSSILLRVV